MAGDGEGQTTVGVSPLAANLYAVEWLLSTALLRIIRLHYIPLIRQWCTICSENVTRYLRIYA